MHQGIYSKLDSFYKSSLHYNPWCICHGAGEDFITNVYSKDCQKQFQRDKAFFVVYNSMFTCLFVSFIFAYTLSCLTVI